MILTETDQHTKLLHVQFHIANLMQRLREFNYKCFAIKKSEEKGIYILHLSFQIPVKFHRNFRKYESHYIGKYECCNVDKSIERGPIFTGKLLFKKQLVD